jgi:hypothetical protein
MLEFDALNLLPIDKLFVNMHRLIKVADMNYDILRQAAKVADLL